MRRAVWLTLDSDMHVTEKGQELLTSGAPYNLQWFFTAEDEQRTFDISYTVTGALVVAPDMCELPSITARAGARPCPELPRIYRRLGREVLAGPG